MVKKPTLPPSTWKFLHNWLGTVATPPVLPQYAISSNEFYVNFLNFPKNSTISFFVLFEKIILCTNGWKALEYTKSMQYFLFTVRSKNVDFSFLVTISRGKFENQIHFPFKFFPTVINGSKKNEKKWIPQNFQFLEGFFFIEMSFVSASILSIGCIIMELILSRTMAMDWKRLYYYCLIVFAFRAITAIFSLVVSDCDEVTNKLFSVFSITFALF